ncbi:DUF1707 domain-containing protein [Nocardioides marmotae]|uniref:DUF1707 SHOCT-like domain-containing protein n=1 Tax=Nocardioides marmotae TaxID=2663857 RepID=UPI0012B63DFD|nr:DUF1707 domain-containing protein [Nocardioides marmotae]MBC9732453.1 DUF1707 domain-containing protein [Nocardioides marmotae]MTB83572.1 DUF1707 domain-containing protein [Nocardioides marmotae]
MNEHLRIGDAERDRAASDLAEHYAEGRLTAAEHAERLDRIWAARTRADLVPVFGDLPARTGAYAAVPARPRHRPSSVVLALAGVLLVLTVLTHLPFVLVALLLFVVVRRHRRRAWLPSGT